MSRATTRTRRALAVAAATAIAVTGLLTACSSGSAASGDGKAFTVGLLLPENQVIRWEKYDRPVFTAELKKQCPNCKVIYANAAGDETKQQSQAESMMAQGVNLLVLTPVDAKASKSIVDSAKSRDIPVLGYARVPGGKANATVGDDLLALGRGNGSALLDAIKAKGLEGKGSIVAINGDTGVSEVHTMVEGWKSVLQPHVKIGREFFTPGWDPGTAQSEMDQAITALGKQNIIGVMSMNDGMAGGAIAAMKAAGISPLPPVTGMDAEVASMQRLLIGEQVASVFNSPIAAATKAADIVGEWAKTGKAPKADGTTQNATGDTLPLYKTGEPPVITVKNMQAEIIDKGIHTYDEICTAQYKAACDQAGLKPATN